MAQLTPSNLVLRCYGYRQKNNRWYGVCLNLNLAAEADSPSELRQKIHEMIESYFEAVSDTDDKNSIPELLSRKAPTSDWIKYYLIRLLISVVSIRDNITFKESIPFHLPGAC